MILIEIEDHCNSVKSIVEARDTMHAHEVLTNFGFEFILKGEPKDYYADDCIWAMEVDGEEVSAMAWHAPSMNIDYVPHNFVEIIRNKRIENATHSKG